MSRYEKGANFEREIMNEFWKHGWAAMRSAGSGAVSMPVPDVIGIRKNRLVLIECKTTKSNRLSLKKAILSLKRFSEISGGKAYIGIKFYKEKPRFFDIDEILSRKNFTISLNDSYLTLDSILGEQRILR